MNSRTAPLMSGFKASNGTPEACVYNAEPHQCGVHLLGRLTRCVEDTDVGVLLVKQSESLLVKGFMLF